MASLQSLNSTPQHFKLFPNLPPEVRILIWEADLKDRKGRFIYPVLECVPPPHILQMGSIDYEYEISESCCQHYIIRLPVPPLLHVCRESRAVARKIYIDIGQGSPFNPARDQLVVLSWPKHTSFRCKRHDKDIIGLTPNANNGNISDWTHVRHIIYYAPMHSWDRPPGRRLGQELQCMFRERAGGIYVETITVIIEGEVSNEKKEEFRNNLKQAWMEPFGNVTDKACPYEPVLKLTEDATIVRQVKQLTERVECA